MPPILRQIAAVRFPVVLLFCLLIAQTASAAAEATHTYISTLETQKTAAAIRLSHKSQNTED